MRREVRLDNLHPYFSIELTFTPSSVIVLNNTDQSVYLRIGGLSAPSARFFDREILPTVVGIPANVALPNNSYQFAGYLPTPSDTTKNAIIIFQGTQDPFSNRLPFPFSALRGGFNMLTGLATDLGNKLMGGGRLVNYREYRMNALNTRQAVDLAWEADTVFILNNTDATLYIGNGGTAIPSATFNDLGIPEKAYAILQPHGGWQYGFFLDSPSEKDCFIIFAYGFADEYQYLRQWGYLPPQLMQSDLDVSYIFYFEPSVQVVADFTFVVSP